MRKLGIALMVLVFITSLHIPCFANGDSTEVKWLSWPEAMELYKQEKRKILIDVYTDWCGWCKRMDQVTFKHPEIAVYINKNFYPVRFNAEGTEDLEYKGVVYRAVKSGKREYHEFANELLKGRFSFPTMVFMDEDLELIQSIIGFKTPRQFEEIASYFATDHYKKTPWSLYQKSFKSKITD